MSNAATGFAAALDEPADAPGRPHEAPAPASNRGSASTETLINLEPAEADEYFGVQSTRAAHLPDPEPLLVNLTRSVLEVLAGARELDQLIRWVTQEVYETLLKRVVLAARARAATGRPVNRPRLTVLRTLVSEPVDGVVEAVVIVQTPVRMRSIAIRLEGLDSRWRASAISVL